MFEQVGGLLIPLSAGANVTYPVSLKPVTLFKTLAERKATLLLVVPQVLDLFLKGVEREVSRRGKERAWRLLLNVARFAPYRVRRLFSGACTEGSAGPSRTSLPAARPWTRVSARSGPLWASG